MRPGSRQAPDDFLSLAETISDDIIDEAVDMPGVMPRILPILRKRPDYSALSAIFDLMAARPGSMDA